MSLNGGDALARGAKSAQFAGASLISQFEDDLIFRSEIVAEKYGLTDEQIAAYKQDREDGKKLPELPTVAELKELADSKLNVGFSVKDSRRSYLSEPESKPVVEAPKKWPEQTYGPMRTILDRVLVKRVPDDPNMEMLEDGSMRDKRTGFVTPAKYRQHSNIGVVLAVGDFVVMGGVKTPLSDFVKPGDKVKYGDYNSEVYYLSDEEVEKLCDAVEFNFVSDPEGLRVIRVQDIRTIQHRKCEKCKSALGCALHTKEEKLVE